MKKILLTSCIALAITQIASAQKPTNIQQELMLKSQNLAQPVQKSANVNDGDMQILDTINFVIDTTGGDLWTRPFDNMGACAISGVGVDVNYVTTPLSVDQDGTYTITAVHNGYDGYLILYQTAFDINNQCTNLIGINDDFNGIDDSQILDINLMTGESYIIVHTGYDPASFGSSDIEITGVGLPTVPVELQSFSID